MGKALVGKTLTSIQIAKDQMALKFDCSDGSTIIAKTDGDCCSKSWIQHIELPALGLPALVTEERDLLELKHEEIEYGAICHYGYQILTDRGEILIDYRNESNGYYGGDLCWPGDIHYSGVHGQNDSKLEWVDLSKMSKDYYTEVIDA